MSTEKMITPSGIKSRIDNSSFTPTQWIDGGEPAIDADKLNRYETVLDALMGDKDQNNIIEDIVNTFETADKENADALAAHKIAYDIEVKNLRTATSTNKTNLDNHIAIYNNDMNVVENSLCWKTFS